MTDREPPREPGWYRVTKDGWQFVCDADEEPDLANGWMDLVKVERDHKAVPLW